MRQDVNVSLRNKEMNESLTTYAPKISSEMKKEAAMKHMASKIRKGYEPVPMVRG